MINCSQLQCVITKVNKGDNRYANLNQDLVKVVDSSKKSKKSLSDNDNKNSMTQRKNDTNTLDGKHTAFNRQKNSLPENIRASNPALKQSKLDDSKRKTGAKPKTHNRNKDSHGKNGSFQPYTVSVSCYVHKCS
jgi:hypothetical protein